MYIAVNMLEKSEAFTGDKPIDDKPITASIAITEPFIIRFDMVVGGGKNFLGLNKNHVAGLKAAHNNPNKVGNKLNHFK